MERADGGGKCLRGSACSQDDRDFAASRWRRRSLLLNISRPSTRKSRADCKSREKSLTCVCECIQNEKGLLET
jgi:hypothetical protein